MEDGVVPAPVETEFLAVQGVVEQEELAALRFVQAAFYEIQVEQLVSSVELVADDWMSMMGEVDSDLVFAAGEQVDFQQAEPFGLFQDRILSM
jgi:hypothetical protein